MWNPIKDTALTIVQSDARYRAHTHASLDAVYRIPRRRATPHLPKVGVAVAMNFFKDSQAPALRGKPLATVLARQTGTSVWAADYHLYSTRPNAERGKWNCVEDVHRWAARDAVAPLEIDRTLYLVGSGRYGEGTRLELSQGERYRRLFAAMVYF